MQATQSSNADGKRAFPSPFTAPIQAARRLMESQRQDEEHSESEPDSKSRSEDPSGPAYVGGEERPGGLTGAWRGQIRYDEAAIVASLDAGLESAEAAGFEAAGFEDGLDPGRVFGTEGPASGKPDQPFGKPPFLSLGLDFRGNRGPDLRWDRGPDPNAVRAAISRLARESQGHELQSKEAGTHKAVASKGAAAFADAVAFGDAVAFADVARRVWGEVHNESAPLGPREDVRGHESNLADGNLAGAAESSETSAPIVTSAYGTADVTSPMQSAASSKADLSRAQALSINTGISDTLSVSMRSDESGSVESQEASVLSVPNPTLPPRSAESTEEGECLAHDAGNLLSAMRLYSELLCISGVLQERHRHYAEDLKLLATRSQRLIDRLLKLGERLAAGQLGVCVADDENAEVGSGAKTRGQTPVPNTRDINGDGRYRAPVEAARRASAAEPQALFDAPVSTEAPGLDFAPTSVAEDTRLEGTNVSAALERLGNVLHTISHGALRIDLEPNSALPVAIGLEPLERILVNLVSNATAAVQANGGAIRIRTAVQDRTGAPKSGRNQAGILVLTVDDSGCGMSAAQIQEALGERDEAEARPDVPGPSTGSGRRGLGLRIVRELVASSGGRLFIQSRPGTGTRIEIHWDTLRPAANPMRERPLQQTSLLQSGPANSSAAPMPVPGDFDPAVPRKPVGVSGARASRASVQSDSVSRIRAGSVAGDEGAVAC